MNFLTNYTIKAKIKIIAFSAMVIIISMLASLILFYDYHEKQVIDFTKSETSITTLSNNFHQKLLNQNNQPLSKKEIDEYFNNLKKNLHSSSLYSKDSSTQNLLNTFIVLLTTLLLFFMFFGYLLDKTIRYSLQSLKQGMTTFFNYIINNEKQIDKIDIIYKDEVGDILEYINKHLNDVKKIIEHEREFNTQLEISINSQTELLLEKSNYLEQYKYMIDEAEAVIQFDLFGNIIDTNDHYCNLSKYSREELVGQPIVNFLNSKDPDNEFYKKITNVIIEGTVYKGINSDVSKEGDVFTTKTVILPMINKEGIIEYFFCVRTDITQLIELTNDIIDTQKDVISTMGEIGESRSKETGQHVKRVAEYSKLLAIKYGLSKEDCDLIYNASPMHDIGKVAISDEILKKPARLTQEEFEIMKTHARLGYDMLKNSKRPILSSAAIIAHEHHERYDGTGYPNNKKGEDIHIFGRITAIADIFDALGSDRCYKKAWELEKIIELLIFEKGKHFDPVIIDLFIDNLDEFLCIRDKFQDNLTS